MKKTLRYAFLPFFLFVLSTCTQKSYVEITKTSFQEEIKTQENLQFTFNRAIVGDSSLNTWDTTQYIVFEPFVAGKFKWVSPKEVIFSPQKSFQPSTDYKAQFNPDILYLEDNVQLSNKEDINFHTTYLSLSNTDAFWSQDERRTDQLRINLTFNYQVYPKSLQNLIQAKAEAEPIPVVKILNTEPSNVVELVIEEVGSLDLDDKKVSLEIAPGIKCAESNYITPKSINSVIDSPAKNQLQITGISLNTDKAKRSIQVKTNQKVSLVQILNHLTIRPKMVYEIQSQENGFIIKGNFKSGESYSVMIDKNIQGLYGATLKDDYEQTLTFGKSSPFISFVNNGIYLSNKGQKNVGIRIYNVPKINLKIYKVYENNLIHFLKNFDYLSNNSSLNYYGRNIDDFGDLIKDQEIETKTLPRIDEFRVLNMDLDQENPDRGIYVVQVHSNKDIWLNSTRIISLSDIGLMAKESKNDILVFCNSLINAQSQSGIKVNLLSQSNQVIAQANTDRDGLAYFPNIKNKYPQANIRLVTAQQNRDFNFLHFSRSQVEQSRFETGGYSLGESGYQAFIYGERDLYRPGEKVNVNVVLRDKDWQLLSKIPIKLKFKLPNGKDMTSIRGLLNEQGAYSASFALPGSAITGSYTIDVFTSTDQFLASMPISVEEFIPDRIRLKVKLLDKDRKSPLKKDLKSGDSLRVQLNAVNLFGPPAANKNYQLNINFNQKAFNSKKYPDHSFRLLRQSSDENNYNSNPYLESKNTEGQTDAKGNTYDAFAISSDYKNIGLLNLNIYATVFDETGRSVSRTKNVDVYTQKVFLGIKSPDRFNEVNQSLNIGVLAIDKNENLVNTKARIQLIRYRWQTVLERDYSGNLSYQSRKKEEIVEEREILITRENLNQQFIPKKAGQYTVRLKFLKDDKHFVSQSFYVNGYSYAGNSSLRVNKVGDINIKLDKDKYQVGEQAKVLFSAPFNGKMLVTIEQDKVLQHFYLSTKNKTASTNITISEEHLPNIYISATLIKPVSDGAIPLTVAHGYKSLSVESPKSILNLAIEAPEKSESQKSQVIKVKTQRPESDIQVSIAVVDEGILQIKNFKTPDPHGFFYQKRRLGVEAFDIYPQLFPEITLSSSSTGGGGADLGLRTNPMVNKRVKLVSYWSGILRTNAQGEVSYKIDIPEFSGSLRVMAVAYKDGAFGSARHNIKVADPIVISTGLPRFLSPGDKVKVPVSLSNTTDLDASAEVTLSTSDNLSINGKKKDNIQVKRNSEKNVEFEIEAAKLIDSAQVTIRVNSMGRVFTQKIDINIRATVGLVKKSGFGEIKAGSAQSFSLKHDFLPVTTKAKLVLGKSPMVQFTENLDYLIRYPYGCLEQITSSVFPQLYVQDLMEVVQPSLQNTSLYRAEIRENVQEGLMRLLARQNYDGGLSYWPGGESNWFGTAYATHFMIEAREAGYFVDQSTIDRMLQYLKNQVNRKNLVDYYYRLEENSNRTRRKKIAPKQSLYSLYVMSLAGQPYLPLMNYYKENPQLLALDSRYLLAVSYLLENNREAYQALLPEKFTGEIAEQDLSGSFHSYIRDEALILNALVSSDEIHPQVSPMARHLSTQLRKATYLNTQERAFSLLALGKLSRNLKKQNTTATIKIAGQDRAQFLEDNLILTQNIAGEAVSIQTRGEGSLYYFWEMSGLSASGQVKEADKNLKVRKTFYNQDGRLIKDNVFRQNDLVIVKITLSAEPYYNVVDNVVITDMLPAGLEIENPRLGPNRSIQWIRGRSYPDYVDMRDDRINYFAKATDKPQHFYYLARAVSKGTFQMGPVSADAMYSGDYYSYNGAGSIKIVDRTDQNN